MNRCFILSFIIYVVVQIHAYVDGAQFCSFKDHQTPNDQVKELYLIHTLNNTIGTIKYPLFLLTRLDTEIGLNPNIIVSDICTPILIQGFNNTATPKFSKKKSVTYDYSCIIENEVWFHSILLKPFIITTNNESLTDQCSCMTGNENPKRGEFISGVEITIIGYKHQFIFINAMSYHYLFGRCQVNTIYSDQPLKRGQIFKQTLILEERSDTNCGLVIIAIVSLVLGFLILCGLVHYIWKEYISSRQDPSYRAIE
ncbi:hypothetical protein CYY_007663 [Polysphondylium violaceum]|uniref:Uncharacterized protein n=1 Tax=Polysphondylium violaceum TaxID=133409 RepID=A0A8J4PN82_9MYCE|nr:hypothetical protein CYY_007663 [Polysphondylium violaceum]